MSNLIDFVRARNLTVIDYARGSLSVGEDVREGNDNRFQLDLLDTDGTVVQAWRGANPEELFADALGRTALGGLGQGYFKMRIFDRYGGHPQGETVTFTTALESGDEVVSPFNGEALAEEYDENYFSHA